MNRKVTFIICSLLLCSCNREVDFYFNFGSQSLCVYKSSFYNLSIENDAMTPDGNHTKGRYPYSGLIQQILLLEEYI